MAEGALGVAESIASSMGSAASNLANAFINAINVAINALNGLIKAINVIHGINISTVSHVSAVSWDFGASSIADTAAGLRPLLGTRLKRGRPHNLILGPLVMPMNKVRTWARIW